MDAFKFSNATSLSRHIDYNLKGVKFGEKVITVSSLDELENSNAKYVLFGIPTFSNSTEKFGIENSEIFQRGLKHLLNIQYNQFNPAEQLIVLGEIDVDFISKELNELKTNSEKIDIFQKTLEVTIYEVAHAISISGKIPILIGGDDKNTMQLLKGMSSAQNSTMNLLDLSPQVNLNFENTSEFLNKYHAFGLHKNYISQEELEMMNSSKNLNYYLYEDCLHLTTLDKCIRFKNAVDFLNRKSGFKLDLKSIQGMSSECESCSGFSLRDIRTFIKIIKKEQPQFLHICGLEGSQKENIGHVLSYLISDFIRNED